MVMKAAVGETVTVKCPQAVNQGIYSWCKAVSKRRCVTIVSTKGFVHREYSGRASITKDNGLISVTITRLQERDTGTYWCGHQNADYINILDVILLKVFAELWTPIKSQINGITGKAVTVQCLYTEQFIDYNKLLCKVTSVNECTSIASSDGHVQNLYKGRASITTNDDQRFAVTMSNIRKRDGGEYWCGAAKIVEVEIAQVKVLNISNARRPTLSTEVISTTPTVSINIKSKIAQQTWYIILSAVLGLLILSLMVLLIWRKKRMKTAKDKGNNENPEPPITVSKFDREAEDMITYSTVTIQPSAQTEGNSATYANLKDLKKQHGGIKINSSESVEYSTLSFKS
ncbi:polymeric immunoglobulin receptor-like isoform X2 [Heptranchias perlo]